MPRDSAAADRPASYLVGTAAAFPLFFRDRAKPINQLPFSPSAKFPKSGSSCESRANLSGGLIGLGDGIRLLHTSDAFRARHQDSVLARFEAASRSSSQHDFGQTFFFRDIINENYVIFAEAIPVKSRFADN